MHKYAVLIGRFQPFHNGHLALVREALKVGKKLIIVIGSWSGTKTPRNPFSAGERAGMITASLTEDENARVEFAFVHDHLYDMRAWISEVRQAIEKITNHDDTDVALCGFKRDATSGYLSDFPDWSPIYLEEYCDGLNATSIRKRLFERNLHLIDTVVPIGTQEFLERYIHTPEFDRMYEEYTALWLYKESWSQSPYPPIFVTVDTIVTYADYVLLVKRKDAPGRGLWAIPGGFVNQDETLREAALRELNEETALMGASLQLKSQHVFDHPQRSQRGRVITHAYHYEASNMPTTTAGDDAAETKWFPIHKLASIRDLFHDDHFSILEHFLGAI